MAASILFIFSANGESIWILFSDLDDSIEESYLLNTFYLILKFALLISGWTSGVLGVTYSTNPCVFCGVSSVSLSISVYNSFKTYSLILLSKSLSLIDSTLDEDYVTNYFPLILTGISVPYACLPFLSLILSGCISPFSSVLSLLLSYCILHSLFWKSSFSMGLFSFLFGWELSWLR